MVSAASMHACQASTDGRPAIMVPDHIINLEFDAAEPIITGMLRYGQRIAVVGVFARDPMRTTNALELVGLGHSAIQIRVMCRLPLWPRGVNPIVKINANSDGNTPLCTLAMSSTHVAAVSAPGTRCSNSDRTTEYPSNPLWLPEIPPRWRAPWCAATGGGGRRHRRPGRIADKGPVERRAHSIRCREPQFLMRALFVMRGHRRPKAGVASGRMTVTKITQDEITRLTALGPLPFLSGSTSKVMRCPSVRSFNPARSTAVM